MIETHIWMALGSWQILQGRKKCQKVIPMPLMRNPVCLIRSLAGIPGGFLEAGDNDPHSLKDLFPWQPTKPLSI